MVRGGVGADVQRAADVGVAQAVGEALEDLALTRCERRVHAVRVHVERAAGAALGSGSSSSACSISPASSDAAVRVRASRSSRVPSMTSSRSASARRGASRRPCRTRNHRVAEAAVREPGRGAGRCLELDRLHVVPFRVAAAPGGLGKRAEVPVCGAVRRDQVPDDHEGVAVRLELGVHGGRRVPVADDGHRVGQVRE